MFDKQREQLQRLMQLPSEIDRIHSRLQTLIGHVEEIRHCVDKDYAATVPKPGWTPEGFLVYRTTPPVPDLEPVKKRCPKPVKRRKRA